MRRVGIQSSLGSMKKTRIHLSILHLIEVEVARLDGQKLWPYINRLELETV